MVLRSKINRTQLAKRYVLNKNYSIIRFFHAKNPEQKYPDINQLVEFILRRKIDIEFIDYEIKTIKVTRKVRQEMKDCYFIGHDENNAEYFNVYSSLLCEFNDFLDVYYQWVNLKTGHCFSSANFVLSKFNRPDEKIEEFVKKLLNEKALVL